MAGKGNPNPGRLSIPEQSRPDEGKPEDGLSLQVNVDVASNRGLSVPPAPSPLPASPSTKSAEPPSRLQTANNSQDSAFSSQQPSAEHFLLDLITPTETTSDGLSDALRRLKRPHEGEVEDEPLAKRDRLGDDLKAELEELHAIALAAGVTVRTTDPSNPGNGDQAHNMPSRENPTSNISIPNPVPEDETATAASGKADPGKTPEVDWP